MIGFSAAWVLGIAAAAALVVGALHLLSVQRPSLLELPTARFVPVGDARAVARQPRPDDLLLLLLRVLALLLAGAAAAGIAWQSRTPTRVRVVVADARLRADSAVWLAPLFARDGDAAATAVLWIAPLDDEPGAALVVAMREARRVAREDAAVGSVALLVATPRVARSWQGYMAWRRAWPGAMTLVLRDSAGVSARTAASPTVSVRARDPDDAVASAVTAMTMARPVSAAEAPGVTVRIDRDGSTDLDRDGAIVVHWPVSGAPTGWQATARADSVGAVVAGGRALVGPWLRTAHYVPAATDTARAIAWWSDGAIAAVERTVGTTCVREAGVRVDAGTDLLLAPSASGLLNAITGPCGAPHAPPPAVLRDTVRSLAVGSTSTSPTWPAVDAALLRDGTRATSRPSWLAVICALSAFAVLLAEHVVRTRGARTGRAAA